MADTDSSRPALDIDRVPLLLAFPTAILASNLVLESPHTATELLLSSTLVPLFLAAAITLIFTHLSTPTPATSRRTKTAQRTLITLTGLFVAAPLLGTIRTVVLALVLIINVHVPYLVVSLLFDCGVAYTQHQLTLVPKSCGESNLYAIIVGYAALYFVSDGLREIDQVQSRETRLIPSIVLACSGAGLVWWHHFLHPSMILVTIASAVVFFISTTEAQNTRFKQGSPTVVGFIAVLLEILSFSSNFLENKFVAIAQVMLVFSTAFIDVDEDLFAAPTAIVMHAEEPDELSIIQQLFLHEDTKAIFSYLMLNTLFMFVQFLYSFRSKSLGLLSDSLHMALDCTSLALGLVAGVLAKRPANAQFPFGLTRIETLAGFANGVLLIGIVAGIFMEAIERIINPVTLERTGELLIVSFLGFVVNIIGIFAFNHGHAHGHSHSHSHSNSHSHSHGDSSSGMADNENMKGIFLHILADTLGSAGVVVSTILTSIFHSNIFDPIASLFIAIMIFISAIPLIKSSASNLLLSLDDKKEGLVRDILSEISTTPGVIGYTTPRFWVSSDMKLSTSPNHGHSHSIEVGHTHSHESHSHSHADSHSHSHSSSTTHPHTEEECTSKPPDLVGFIHIQYADGDNSTIIKKRVQKIFENHNTRAIIQVENESSTCWCRTKV